MRDGRRRELTEFLRTHRAAVSPRDVELPSGDRRRTPGLRREEVASLAGVSVTWYTFLEQGRPIRMSAEALQRVAQVLRLSPQETRHLFLLADRAPLPDPDETPIPAAVAALVANQAESPAWLVDVAYNAQAWSRAASAVWLDLDAICPEDRNLIWLLYTRPELRQLYVDWDAGALIAMAALRARAAENRDDPRFGELVDRVSAASPTFREWWPQQQVAYPTSGTINLIHPEAGPLHFHGTAVVPESTRGLRLIIWTPDDDGPTRKRVRRLVSRRTSPPV